jgi:hypothetical protein
MMLTFELAQKHNFNPTDHQLAKLYLDSITKETGDKLKMAALILDNDLKKLNKTTPLPETFELDYMAYALSESIEEADDVDLPRKQVYHAVTSKASSTSTSSTTAVSSLTPETTPVQPVVHSEKQVQFCSSIAPV